MHSDSLIRSVSAWLNENQGVLTVVLFVLTLLLGWVTGIFQALKSKPKFRITSIPGPTFVSVLGTGRKHGLYDEHRTCIALYLQIINSGSAGGAIDKIRIGYHWHIRPPGPLWLKYGLGWFWIDDQTVALDDFQVAIGDKIKVFPFLTQRSHISGRSTVSYLRVGEATSGVVYFEQQDSFGGCFPSARRGHVSMRVTVIDSLGGQHRTKLRVPRASLVDAQQYNPSFARTYLELRGEDALVNLPVDEHGNILPISDGGS